MSERKDVVYRDLMDMGPWDGHGLEMKTYDAPENDKQIPHSSVHEALQVTRARNKKENGIGRNRELAQDAQWSRSTLVSSPSRRQAKCSQTGLCWDAEHDFQNSYCVSPNDRLSIIRPSSCSCRLDNSYHDGESSYGASHPGCQQSLSLSDYIYFQGSPGDFYSHAVSNTLARLIVPWGKIENIIRVNNT